MEYMYIGIILICRVVQNLFSKKVSMYVGGIRKYVKYAAFSQAVSALLGLCLMIVCGIGFKADAVVVCISVFSGLMLALSSFCGLFAMHSGTITINSMFGTAGIIIPCVFGIFMFGQPMSVWQWFGMALFMVSAYFLTKDSKNTFSGFSLKTAVLLIGNLLGNGFCMLAQQMFSYYRPEVDVAIFSFLSFGTVGIMLAILLPFLPKSTKKSDAEGDKLPGIVFGCGFMLAAAVFVINQLATSATAFISPAVLFSFINGGNTIIAMLVGWLCYKEKLSKEKIIGLIIGVASLLIIKLL